jgi:hypothetical protein
MGFLFTVPMGFLFTATLTFLFTMTLGFQLTISNLMRLESRYGNGRLEDACRRALHFGLHSYRGVKNILDVGLDRVRSEDEARKGAESPHPNIRGTGYYS